ncbi:MAG: glycoside hydrolase family 127 protein [Prevotella sp.]|nr:glycoside hydrolase family 127 protein [Prevotella sp.]
MKRLLTVCFVCCCTTATITAQGLTDMSRSRQAKMQNLPLGATQWTGGFWGDRFSMLSTTGIWDMWETWNTPWETLDANGQHGSNGFRNFEVAAGTVKGKHHGPPFHDGDMYKWLEACAAVYAVTKDPKIDELMDKFIEQVRLAQRADGYIHTPVVISERNMGIDSHALTENAAGIEIGKDQQHAFASRLNFETYNLGHLMTAGIVHKRATGKTTLFECGRRAADFLYNFLTRDAAELSRNAICPSHYMGAAEMYRETGDEKYLTLAKGLIAIRDSVQNGEDHNQDRHKLRDQYEAMGHAVRANYLYAGVADLYAETGEPQLMRNLSAIWDDIIQHKIYIMGGCGALYDGVSPDGTTYNQPSIQQIHQAYGRQFQLPQEAAHNEICAQIGMLLYSWRMFQTTADPKYVDNIENELYNGILSGISLDGRDFFYTEALRRTKEFPYVMRWPKHRQHYISCFCCPPNTLRTLCEAQEYAYSVTAPGSSAAASTLYVNLYGQNALKTKDIEVEQTTNYPWDGKVTLTIRKAKNLGTIVLHIPGWCKDYSVSINGATVPSSASTVPNGSAAGAPVTLTRRWKKGDVVELSLDMRPRIIEANPLVEEAKNQIAVMRGPIVYCLEGQDIAAGHRINDIAIPADIKLTEHKMTLANHEMIALEGDAILTNSNSWSNSQLYRELQPTEKKKVHIRLIPYYAWDNRGIQDMSLWLPLAR